MTKVWFDPSQIATSTAVAATGSLVKGVGSIMAGQTAGQQGGAQAGFYDQESVQTQVDETRAHIDLTNESNRTLASARAASAGQGGDIDSGIVSGMAGIYGMKQQRITDDAQTRERMLKARADYARTAGSNTQFADALSGAGSIGAGAFSLYDASKTNSTIKNLNPVPAPYTFGYMNT